MAAFILDTLCRGCQRCIQACPNQAIEMKTHKTRINVDKCTECEKCLEACMHGAITFRKDTEKSKLINTNNIN